MGIALKSSRRKTGGIVNTLREQILSGVLAPGTKIMSARELGEHFKVSPVTANKALLELAGEDLIVRNERSGSFVKRAATAGLHRIGFVDNMNVFHVDIQASCGLYRDTCVRMLSENGCSVRFLAAGDVPDAVLDRELDGVLCYYAGWDYRLMTRMRKTGIPIVLGRYDYVLNTPFHQVLPDIYGAAFEVFSRIRREMFDGLIIVYENHENCLYRRDVALDLARQTGFDDNAIELVVAAHHSIEMNYPVWQDISSRCRGKFIYTCGDVMASGLVRVLRRQGIEPGVDVQLASCGNLEDSGYLPFDEPTITGAGVNYRDYGLAAVNLLSRMLENPEENSSQHIVRVPAVYKKRKTATL